MEKVISTRRGLEGAPRRVRQRADGSRYTTYEVPLSVLSDYGIRKLAEAMDRWRNGERIRAKARALRRAVQAMPDRKASDLAREHGVSEARIRQIRIELRRTEIERDNA